MYRKHLTYLIMESMKYFFNLDHVFTAQLFVIGIVLAGCFRQVFIDTAEKVNATIIKTKTMITTYKEQWENHKAQTLAIDPTEKRSYLRKDLLQWRIGKY